MTSLLITVLLVALILIWIRHANLSKRNAKLEIETKVYRDSLSNYSLNELRLRIELTSFKNLYEELSKTNAILSAELSKNGATSSTNHFSQEELKRIRFCIHPDKTQGKTTELFKKVNSLIK